MEIAELYPGIITEYTWENGILEIKSTGSSLLRIEPITKDIIRVRYATEGYFLKDFSYAIDPDFVPEPGEVRLHEKENHLLIVTESVQCRIDKEDLRVTFLNYEGKVLNRDEKGFHWEKEDNTGNNIVQMTKVAQAKEVFFGLGDKPSELNLRGSRYQNWGTDSYGYDYQWDPLYKNIPFYYGLHDGVGYGIFFDNSFRNFFDFAKERRDACSFWAHGGEMNYYFIAGPQLLDVNKRYAQLTGKPDMPALWSLGFQQCKWSYYPESEVREVTSKLRLLKVPCDAIYLDIDYMDGFRCFTWDYERFPDPKRMVKELNEEGFKTVIIIDPGIKIDPEYSVFAEGIEKDYFCKRLDGPYFNGKVWPGDCYFPDFTKPEVRLWWADLYKELINDIGIAGVWNDMNEPAIFEVPSKTMPDDVLFDYDGHPCSHRKAHNVYGMQMARATYEGVKKHGNNKRGLIITRSGYSGLQRYSSVWTGDNIATWQHIWLANVQCQRLSISGISFAGSDIGGFIGKPTPEMFVRWIQLAIFHPFCRVHSSQDDGDQEPWSFGDRALDLFREAIELRYRMLPYHYTAFYVHHRDGSPILKPLSFYDQEDEKTYDRNKEFICGDHILTASVSKELTKSTDVYIPKGKWYNYWNNKVINGGKMHSFVLSESTFPFYVKEGAILPFYPVQQYVGEKQFDTIDLKVYYKNGIEISHLYEDAHDGYEYESGEYRFSNFQLEGSADSLRITQKVEGNYNPQYYNFNLILIGLSFDNYKIFVDGVVAVASEIPVGFGEIVIRASGSE